MLLLSVRRAVRATGMIAPGDRVLVAASGGSGPHYCSGSHDVPWDLVAGPRPLDMCPGGRASQPSHTSVCLFEEVRHHALWLCCGLAQCQ